MKNNDSKFNQKPVPLIDATAVLNGESVSGYTYSAMYYDSHYRVAQVKSTNHMGGTDVTCTEYSYTGKPLTVKILHTKGGTKDTEVDYTYAYDDADRKDSFTFSISHGEPEVSSTMSYEYDALGRLSKITRPFTTSVDPVIEYKYDLHGWTKKITTHSFQEELSYADGLGTPCYNGNISSIRWKDKTSNAFRGYKYTYDNANRLTSGVYGEGDALTTNVNRFSENVGYDDVDGNITAITRYGKTSANGYGQMDNLTLSYNGYQLAEVSETVADYNVTGSFEYKKAKGSQYKYNNSGSLIADKSRDIAFILHDYNNNPCAIYFTNGNVTKYVYSASGEKLRVVHYTAKPNITRTFGVKPAELTQAQILYVDSTDYLLGGSLVVKNGRIDKCYFEGGFARAFETSATTDRFVFYYYNQDHLGNNREVVDIKGRIHQVTNYYPFGAPYADPDMVVNASLQPYKYNGKELDLMHGLNTYDYGARQYNPVIPVWDRMDPLAEKYYNVSPYAYCNNNPVMFIDPDGRDYWSTNNKEEIVAFLNAIGNSQTQFDFSKWEHATDAEICGNLTYNDETHKFYTSYTSVVDGELNVIGKSFDANITPVSYSGLGYEGAYVYQPTTSSWKKIILSLDGGLKYNDGQNNWNVNLSGRITGLAPIEGVVDINTPAQRSKAIMTLLSKGAKVCKSFGTKHGEKIFQLGNRYYSFDNTQHNGGIYKVFEREGGNLKRIGTADKDLRIFKK